MLWYTYQRNGLSKPRLVAITTSKVAMHAGAEIACPTSCGRLIKTARRRESDDLYPVD